jgi:hypothetical protein
MGDQEGVAFMSEQDLQGFDDVTVEELGEASGGIFKASAGCASSASTPVSTLACASSVSCR